MKKEMMLKIENGLKSIFEQSKIDETYKNRLKQTIMAEYEVALQSQAVYQRKSFAWGYAMAVFAVMLIAVFVIGPARVLGQVQEWLSYVPGIGVVSSDEQLWTLEAPLLVEGETVALSIHSATLTDKKAVIDYGFFLKEGVVADDNECSEKPYLLFADGTEMVLEDGKITVDALLDTMGKVDFVVPCVPGGTSAQENHGWVVPLRFVKVDRESFFDFKHQEQNPIVMSPHSTDTRGYITVDGYVRVNGNIIVEGSLKAFDEDSIFEISGVPIIFDANGVMIAYDVPDDCGKIIDLKEEDGIEPFVFQIKDDQTQYPIRLHFPVRLTNPSSPTEFWELEWFPEDLAGNEDTQICINSQTLFQTKSLPEGWQVEVELADDDSENDILSADGQYRLFVSEAMDAHDGYLLRKENRLTGEIIPLFYLEGSAGKLFSMRLSPNEKYIAYRGSQQASLYIKSMDGSRVWQVMNAPVSMVNSTAITGGFAWADDSQHLAVSLTMPGEQMQSRILMVNVFSCEIYELDYIPGLLKNIKLRVE